MSTQTTKKQPTNPFVYVIAAAIIATLALWLRFLVDALDSNNSRIEQETNITNILVPKKPEVKTPTPTTTATGTATGTTPAAPTEAMPK